MSISSSHSQSASLGGRLRLNTMLFEEHELAADRRELYHSTGAGFVIFRRFLSASQSTHMRRFWSSLDPYYMHEKFESKSDFYSNCPNYAYVEEGAGNRMFHNFLWNTPVDELTYSMAWAVQSLRNRLSGRNNLCETLGFEQRAVNYRVVLTKNGDNIVLPHRDFADYENRFEKGRYDLSRLQATLFLSEKGVDYSGSGFRLQDNSGKASSFGESVDVAPGDLVIWRYANLHSIDSIRSAESKLGFLRIIFPLEILVPQENVAVAIDKKKSRSFIDQISSRLFGS